jgi:hypothetical protein
MRWTIYPVPRTAAVLRFEPREPCLGLTRIKGHAWFAVQVAGSWLKVADSRMTVVVQRADCNHKRGRVAFHMHESRREGGSKNTSHTGAE